LERVLKLVAQLEFAIKVRAARAAADAANAAAAAVPPTAAAPAGDLPPGFAIDDVD